MNPRTVSKALDLAGLDQTEVNQFEELNPLSSTELGMLLPLSSMSALMPPKPLIKYFVK